MYIIINMGFSKIVITNFHVLLITDIPTKVTISGCLKVGNGTKAGCTTDLNVLNENREILVNFLNDEIGSLYMQTSNFTKGQICITRDPYENGGNEEARNKSASISTGCGKKTSRFKFILTLSILLVYFDVLKSCNFQKPLNLELTIFTK